MQFRYYHEPEADRDVIVIDDKPSIWVYNLAYVDFTAPADSRIYYGDDHGDPLAFVMITDLPDLLARMAIEWYAREALDYPEMEILNDDPRPNH